MSDQPKATNGAGKGDIKRPYNGQEFRSNYDNIFRKPKVDGKDSDFDSHDETLYNETPTKFDLPPL